MSTRQSKKWPWLTDSEVEAYTRKKQSKAQQRVLDEAKPPIKYRVVDGKVRVPRSQVEMVDDMAQSPPEIEPTLHLVRP